MLGIRGVVISYLCEMKLRKPNVLVAKMLLYEAAKGVLLLDWKPY